jgi:hypothetical protein
MQPEKANEQAKPEPEPIEIRKLDKIETTLPSNPSGN